MARGLRPPERVTAAAIWAVGGLMSLALALRLTALEVGVSFDEIDTYVHYASQPLGRIATTFDSQNQHLLYSLLARVSVASIGDGVWALRLPAVLLGVLSILALYRLATRVADAREAIFAAALLTVSYHHVWFSQNARGYTGLLLFTLLGSTAFLDMLAATEPRGIGRPLRYGLWMALAVWVHATALFVIAAHALVYSWSVWSARTRTVGANRWQVAQGFLFAASITLIEYALVLPQFFDTLLAPTMPGVATQWKEPSWLVAESLRVLGSGVPGGSFTVAGALVVALLGVRSYWRQASELALLFLLGSVVTTIALLATKHNLWPRMFFSSAGFFVLIALRGVAEWARIFSFGQMPKLFQRMATAALALVCLMSAATLPSAWLPKQDFAGAQTFLQREAAPEDAIVTVDMTVMPYAEFFNMPWSAVDNVDALAAIEADHPRTWLVFCTPTRLAAAQPAMWERLQREYRVIETFWGTLGGSEVVVAMRERVER
jgi:4-amino-4-deoxy-L-arabinose transferase-like glycosyltransferase